MAGPLMLAVLAYEAWLATVTASLQVDGTVGETISLSAGVPVGFNVSGVIWRHVSTSEKLVAMFFKGSPDITYESAFFGRAHLLPNFTLEISKLELGDSGTFKALLMDAGGRIDSHQVVLTVYEGVNKPTVEAFDITSTANRSANSGCHVLLTCGTKKGTSVSYSWKMKDEEGEGVLSKETHSIFDGGKIVKVWLDPSRRYVIYSCTAFNPVSQESTSITPWEACPSNSDARDAVHEYTYFLFIVLPLLVILASAVIVWTIYFVKCSGKKRKKEAENDDNLLEVAL